MNPRTTIGIIGGNGPMGKWLKRYFEAIGYRIVVAGRKTELTYEKLVGQSQIVILSVPQRAAVSICETIGPMMNREQLLMDVCSLKAKMVLTMVDATPAQVLGTHPLFGPMTPSIRGQNIIFCRGRGDDWADRLAADFTTSGAVVTHIDPETHDRHMAVVQGLTHLISICMGRTLQQLNLRPTEALLYATPVFRVKLDLIGRLLAQDLDLYRHLIAENPHVENAVETFISALQEGGQRLISDESVGSMDYLESIRQFCGDFCEKGYRESNDCIDAVYAGREKVGKTD